MKIITLSVIFLAGFLISVVIMENSFSNRAVSKSFNTTIEVSAQPLPANYPGTSFSPGSCASGLYVISEFHKNLEEKIIASPLIDGVSQRSYWKNFEPQEGKYDWSFMDELFDLAIKNNKKVALCIVAGNGQPDWLYEKDIPFLNFTELPKEGKTQFVANVKLPIFWNQKYIHYWTKFVAAVAEHLKSKPGYWDALTLIKVTGFNRWNSDEFRLPAQRNVQNNIAKSTDAIKIWKENGYRPSLVISSFKQVIDSFAKYFPDKQLGLPIITGGRGFPPIDENGREIEDSKSTKDDYITETIVNYMTQKFGKQFMPMFEALTDSPKNNSVSFLVVDQYKKGATIGYQLCQSCYKFPPCLKDKTPCDNNAFYNVLDNGMSQGALYFELYAQNIKAYPEALKKAEEKIKKKLNKQQ
jgi:hypothetical protein